MSKADSRKVRRPALHRGWQNFSGKNAQVKSQMISQMGETVDLTKCEVKGTKLVPKKPPTETSRGFLSLNPPSRQTAPIFKQPVTVVTSQETQCRSTSKNGNLDKPRQLFWEKRLEKDVVGSLEASMKTSPNLAELFKPVGPCVSLNTAIQSLISALHTVPSGVSITGQTGAKSALEKNPGVFLNPDQPLLQTIMISDDDIRQQEERVLSIRHKLQEALRGL